MSDDLEPRRREEDDADAFESLFESFQQGAEAPELESEEESSSKGVFDKLRSLLGRRKAGKKRREQVEQASQVSAQAQDVEGAPVFIGADGQLDIEATRESLLGDLEEEETASTEASAEREREKEGGFLKRLGLSTFQAGCLGFLLIAVLGVYGALGVIIVGNRSQWLPALASPVPTLTPLSTGDLGMATEISQLSPSPSLSPTPDEEEPDEPEMTATSIPTPTSQPFVSTRFDLQVMRNPTDLDLRQQRGEEYLRLKAYEDAAREFEYILSQETERATAHLGLGQATFFLRRWGEAEAELGTAISFDEDLEDAHFWLGLLLYLQGRYETSMREFDWAAEINPEHPRNEAWLARAAVEQGQLSEAQGAVERALGLDEEYPLAYVARAEAAALVEDYESAQGDLLYARDLAPHDFEVLNALARLYGDHFPARLSEAEQIAKQAQNWATWRIDEARALHALGRAYLAQGRKEAALDVLAEASDLASVEGATALPQIMADFDRAIVSGD